MLALCKCMFIIATNQNYDKSCPGYFFQNNLKVTLFLKNIKTVANYPAWSAFCAGGQIILFSSQL